MASSETCTLYLVRHGATDNNLERPPRLQGQRVNLALSAAGRIQAEQTARFLAAQPIAAVFSSPLLRARQTADTIARPHGLTVQLVDALSECDVGAWEDRSWPQIEREEPEAYQQFAADPYRHGYRGGETLQQVEDRVLPALNELAASHAGQRILVVAHNVVNRVLLGKLLDIAPAKRREILQDNCCLNVIEYRDSQPKLVTLNAVFHLSPTTE
jgi:broad specificity phosphatase PhoE